MAAPDCAKFGNARHHPGSSIHVILSGYLKYTIITSTTLILTGSLTYFDLIWVTTQGGPGYATRVLPLQMYITAFPNQSVGYGSTLAVLLAVFGIVLSLLLLRFTGFTKMSSQLEGL